jgi:hypothetical protein
VLVTIEEHLARVPPPVWSSTRDSSGWCGRAGRSRSSLSPRIVKVERYGDIVGNLVRIVRMEELDEELAAWVAESYAHGAAASA